MAAAPRPFKNNSGQALFTALKLRSEGLVPSSGARCAPANSTPGSSTARLFPPGYAAPVRDSRPFRAPASPVLVRGVSGRRNAVPMQLPVPESGQPAAGLSPPGAAGAFPPIKGKRSRPAVPWRPRARHFAPFGPSNSRLFPPSASSPCWSITPNPSRGGQSPGLRQPFEPT